VILCCCFERDVNGIISFVSQFLNFVFVYVCVCSCWKITGSYKMRCSVIAAVFLWVKILSCICCRNKTYPEVPVMKNEL
jgi:hypothetical protein